jgi:Ca2+-binding EF-hand superfamily protein
MVANMDLKEVLTFKNICAAFNMLDKNGNGRIGVKDIFQLMSDNEQVEEQDILSIIEEVNTANKKYIKFAEFNSFMQQLIDKKNI